MENLFQKAQSFIVDIFVNYKIRYGYYFLIFGIGEFTFGFFPFFIGNSDIMITNVLYPLLQLTNGSKVFDLWQNVSYIYFNVYLFNVTNFTLNGRLTVNEVGPFCYRVHRIKTIRAVDEESDLISYSEMKEYFEAETNPYKHCQDPNIVISYPNFELLNNLFQRNTTTTDIEHLHKDLITDITIRDLFRKYKTINSLIFNNDSSEEQTVSRGVRNVSDLGQFQRAEKHRDPNEKVYGEFLVPPIGDEPVLFIYFDRLKRSVPLYFTRDRDTIGISTKQFKITNDTFNKDVSREGNSWSFFASWPHFYQTTSENYLSLVNGLKPTSALHRTHYNIEPKSGAIIASVQRHQSNLILCETFTKRLGIKATSVWPLFWVEEGTLLPMPDRDLLRWFILLSKTVLYEYCALGFNGGGNVCFAVYIILWYELYKSPVAKALGRKPVKW